VGERKNVFPKVGVDVLFVPSNSAIA